MRPAKIFLTVFLLSCFTSSLWASDSLDGYWKAVFQSEGGDGTRDYYFDISQDGEALRGRVISPRGGAYEIQRGKRVDDRVTIVVEREYEGTPVVLTVRGERTGSDRVAGALIVADNEVATFVMERLGRPVGRWQVEATSPDEDQVFRSTLTLRKAEKGYAGAFVSDSGQLEVAGCAWQDDRLVIDIAMPTNDGEIPIRIRAKFGGVDTLEGEWNAEGAGYSGQWRAKRDVVYELAGRWSLRAETPEGAHEAEIEITRKGDAFVGRYKGQFGELVLNSVKRDGNRVAIEMDAPVEGETMTIALAGEFGAADSLAGEWQARNAGYEGEWKAERRPPVRTRFAGEWQGTVSLPSGEDAPLRLVVAAEGGKLVVKLEAPTGEYEPRRVREEDGRLRFQILHVQDGQEVEVYLEGKLSGSGAIEGIWEADDQRGEWRAKKATADKPAPASEKRAKVRL